MAESSIVVGAKVGELGVSEPAQILAEPVGEVGRGLFGILDRGLHRPLA